MKAAIVVPTIRRESIARFLAEWKDEFKDHLVIVVEDNAEPSFDLAGHEIRHYSWRDIDAEFGRDSWIIPRRTDCVRSYGFYKAYQEKVDMVISMDDDCYPKTPQFVKAHSERLLSEGEWPAWISTLKGLSPRGMPYQKLSKSAECVLNHGLWDNVPDFDAVTQLAALRNPQPYEKISMTIPPGLYFPMCGMNVAFRMKAVPMMYFLLMGQPNWPYDRYGDIWCGIFAKKICDHLNVCVKSGEPSIWHDRASNVWTNLRKELPGYEVNEDLWREVDSLVLTKNTFAGCYEELAAQLPRDDDYWKKLKKAMAIWSHLFE